MRFDLPAVTVSPSLTSPTPAGVPVSNKSPSSRVMMLEACAINSGTVYIIKFVDAR